MGMYRPRPLTQLACLLVNDRRVRMARSGNSNVYRYRCFMCHRRSNSGKEFIEDMSSNTLHFRRLASADFVQGHGCVSTFALLALPRPRPNPAVDLAPFGRWTLRDEAAQRRSP